MSLKEIIKETSSTVIAQSSHNFGKLCCWYGFDKMKRALSRLMLASLFLMQTHSIKFWI